ncbi:somatomedin-B and thrombospondin type-1 domain-containing protein isoform X2 [Eupeodes corollae]|uniref:somatomedin-B and thrombospondin type-1 domain-containing protein isoform X2 n=1 Tax=Eupeodes corollae TaxID=290404 RepID=UPI00249079B5|nr:somatomedin-B and thrombospondin type-1 domain-containing protein isoform X2 [Eupeodes corollae]
MSQNNYSSIAVLLFLITFSSYRTVLAGSCREAQLCCNGRDSSCVVQKAPINAIVEDLNDKPCYCDHACLKLGDCCEDFKNHCGVLDCQVSEWGQWSECDKSCGIGMMTRSRSILQASQNGGKHCPSLVQKRGCQGLRCHGHHDRKVLREMALLLPAELSNNHHFNDSSSETRRNLRLRYRASFKHNREHEYCVEYEVIKASKPCHKLTPFNQLLEGDRIVVRCDLEDLPGSSRNTMSISSQSKASPSHNNTASRKTEITNNSALLSDDDEEEEDDEDSEDYDRSTNPSTIATTTTTTTHPSTIYHCRGEGLSGRTTRWSALPAPSCRGKWLRLTVGQPKKCSHPQFIFV